MKTYYRFPFTEHKGCANYDDIAILVLEDRIGEDLGWLGVKRLQGNGTTMSAGGDEKEEFNAAGYPGDLFGNERMMVQEGVKIVKTSPCEGGPVWTDADVSGGASGGPLWRETSIVGVLSMSVGNDNDGWVVVFAGGER